MFEPETVTSQGTCDPSFMTKWEYITALAPSDETGEPDWQVLPDSGGALFQVVTGRGRAQALNALGQLGWELVQAEPAAGVFYFKRAMP